VRAGNWTTKADFTGNPMKNVWDTFDFLAPPAMSTEGWTRVLRQHILSIRESYPRIFEIEEIYSMQDIEDYLVATVLPAKFAAAFAQEIADELSGGRPAPAAPRAGLALFSKSAVTSAPRTAILAVPVTF